VSAVECVVVDLPLAREQALNIALNNREVAGEWDERQLVAVVEELLALPEFDATLTGFDEQELGDLVLGPEPMVEQLDGEDDAEDAAAEVVATLEIPYVRWAAVRARLDELLEAEAEVALHVRMPGRVGSS
jgi:hypothetical protein